MSFNINEVTQRIRQDRAREDRLAENVFRRVAFDALPKLLNRVTTLDVAGTPSGFTDVELGALKKLAAMPRAELLKFLEGMAPDAAKLPTVDEIAAPPAKGTPLALNDQEIAALKSLAAMAPELAARMQQASISAPAPETTADSFGLSLDDRLRIRANQACGGADLEARDLARFRAAHGLSPAGGLRTVDSGEHRTLEDQLRDYQRGTRRKVPPLPEHATIDDRLYHYQRYGNEPPDAA